MSLTLDYGILIAIDGIDGAGKTTQANHIAARLRSVGLDVVLTKEPTSGQYGQALRDSSTQGRLSAEEELHLFIADRREHVQRLILPCLEAGKVVIVDRYYFSTAAYQGARGLDPFLILEQNEAFAPEPDLLVLIDVPPEVGVSRIRQRGDTENLFEKLDDLRRCAEIFSMLRRPYVLHIEGTGSILEITEEILRYLDGGALRDRLCRRKTDTRCEPAYCVFASLGSCPWPKIGLVESSRRIIDVPPNPRYLARIRAGT